MTWMTSRWVQWGIACIAVGLIVLGVAKSFPKAPVNLDKASQLPVLHGGREKPLGAVALNALMVINGHQEVTVKGKRIDAMTWFFDMVAFPEKANEYPVFRVYHPDIHAMLGRTLEDGKYLSFNQFVPHLIKIDQEYAKISKIDRNDRSAYQRALAQLYSQLRMYAQLQQSVSMGKGVVSLEDIGRFETLSQFGHALVEEGGVASLTNDELEQVGQLVSQFKTLQQLDADALLRIVPSPQGWISFQAGVLQSLSSHRIHPVAFGYASLVQDYRKGDGVAFSLHLEAITKQVSPISPRISLEYWMTKYPFFYASMIVYVIVALGILVAWIKYDALIPWMYRLTGVTFLVHTFGLAARIYIQGRPPVTNLYSSSVFVGWAAVLICLVLERYFKNSIQLLIAAIMGFVTLIIAHHLSFQGDTLEMMQAVLDSNFWLSTHVITITLGYSAVFVLGFLGHIYLFKSIFTKTFTQDDESSLYRLMMGVAAFALLLSTIGTILGGIWADQSWGRFWGWDPKENGALLIVLWLAIIFHARLAGMVKGRGVAVMAVFANIVTAFSWFGVNMLGVGLHSYGFMDSMFQWLIAFVMIELIVIWIGLAPKRMWRSQL